MRFLFRSFLFLFLLVVVVAGASYFLPSDYTVERSRTMQAPPEAVYAAVDEISRWQEWSVWNQDADLKVAFSGPARGPGARMSWEHPSQGKGSLTITKSKPGTGVWFDLVMDAPKFTFEDQMRSKLAITYKRQDEGVEVKWRHWGEFNQKLPVLRYVGLFADRLMGADFATNLENIEGALKKGAKKGA